LKKYKDALTDYEQSDKLEKFKRPDYIVAMGQLAFEAKEFDKVITYFNRTIPLYKPEQKAELTFAYFGKGRAALELKKKDAARKDLQKALELSPGNKEIESYLAKADALPN
jgi:tetratricopeptide (TPR) repeat protein